MMVPRRAASSKIAVFVDKENIDPSTMRRTPPMRGGSRRSALRDITPPSTSGKSKRGGGLRSVALKLRQEDAGMSDEGAENVATLMSKMRVSDGAKEDAPAAGTGKEETKKKGLSDRGAEEKLAKAKKKKKAAKKKKTGLGGPTRLTFGGGLSLR